ncbi:DCLK3 [Acanthosepion pharaonis]|uniref:non-specific serine/threonine protein kinase n=1 Tax=Acanthosepion pharaonis TaxID=158019 RepID=A0A812EG46_ACAPH|nr:DCLK3 [Sepia pharaonis]
MVPFAKRLADIGTSQAHRDLVEDRYRELRRPRRIFTPLAGENIKNIEELQDGKSYVCAGFEPFKAVKYGNFELEPWSIARPHEQVSLDLSKGSGTPGRDQSNAFNPSRFFHSSLNSSRKYVPSFGLANRTSQNDNGYRRPKLITIVRYGPRPRNSIKLLLNRQSVMSFEQLLADIADSFGPKWENNKLRKLYTFRGKQVQGVSDFFRDDNIFIGIGTESVSDNDLQDILEELQPNNPHTKKLIRQWDKTKHRKTSQDGYLKFESEKLDSGFGSSDIGRKEAENNEKNNCTVIGDSGAGRAINYRSSRVSLEHQLKVNQNKDFRLVMRVDRERERAAYEERVRARKRQKKLKETEKQILDEERRRMNKQLGKDPMKKLKDDRRVGPINENDLRQEKTQLQQSPRDKNEVSMKLYEEFETSDRIYLAMELVKGGDLFDAITQSVKFREPDAAGMVKDLCNALFYLHSMKIVHRDLKPENLLVHWNKDGNMSLKLADFGLAMEVDEPIFTVCGTPTYVAPEILCQTGYGLEVDMWAIGVISFILLCGFPPFHSHDRCQSELFECIKSGEYEFLRPYWDDVSLHAKDLIEHLLLVDKEQRYKASQVLVHPWIICGGDTSRILSGPELAEAQKTLHGQLDAEAKRNFEVFHRLREQMN